MRRFAFLLVLALGCGDDDGGTDAGVDAGVDAPGDSAVDVAADVGFDAGFDATPPCDPEDRTQLRVVTFNTGTTEGMGMPDHPDGYDEEKADFSDMHYGDGLAWSPAVEATRQWLAEHQPDIIAFQEIFYSGECLMVPTEAREGFVCETWTDGDPTVANVILGAGYQVACHLEKSDKCVAVRREVGTFRGCDADLCLDGLDGGRVEGCGGGSRVGRGVIDLVEGGTVTIASFHGSSGLTTDDQNCRVRQFDQVFVDLLDGSGEPAANGTRNIVLGDFNTDPWRTRLFDASAMRLNEHIDGSAFRFVSEVGPDAPGSYADAVDIDHVVSDVFVGSCWYAGLSDGRDAVYEPSYFDHRPVVCDVEACSL